MKLLFPINCLVCNASMHGDNYFKLYCCNPHRQQAYRNRSWTPASAPVHLDRNTPPAEQHPNNRRPQKPLDGQLNSNTYAQLGSDRC